MKNIDIDAVRANIKLNGFNISKRVIDLNLITLATKQIVEKMSNSNIKKGIVWEPYIGERDKICYSEDDFQCMYRGYAFPWNFDYNEYLNLLENIGDIRNKVFPNMIEKNIGSYATFSLYPTGKGFLKKHSDSIETGKSVGQFIIPLTKKYKDFESGGLFIISPSGDKIDVDNLLDLGDVLFFDGSLEHGVDLIQGQGIGRLQISTIPTIFTLPIESDRLIMDVDLSKIINVKLKQLLKNLIL